VEEKKDVQYVHEENLQEPEENLQETEGKKEPRYRDVVNCINCGGTAFIKASKLGPRPNPKAPPVVYEKIWICAGCGSGYTLDEFPIKGQKPEERPKSAILIPPSRNKLVVAKH